MLLRFRCNSMQRIIWKPLLDRRVRAHVALQSFASSMPERTGKTGATSGTLRTRLPPAHTSKYERNMMQVDWYKTYFFLFSSRTLVLSQRAENVLQKSFGNTGKVATSRKCMRCCPLCMFFTALSFCRTLSK